MNSEFAYSGTMQLLLMCFTLVYNFIMMYFIAHLILRIHGERASVRQKAVFSFLTGTVMYAGLIYLVYYIGGMLSFGPLLYLLVTSPNPLTALVYCYLGIKILRLPSVRSVELMGNVYLYYSMINSITRLVGSIFFVQHTERYNYLLDFWMMVTSLIIFLAIAAATMAVLRHNADFVVPKTHVFVNPTLDVAMFLLKACLIYIVVVTFPLLIAETVVANALIFVFLAILLVVFLLQSNYRHARADILKKELHLSSLIKNSDEFRAVKHDFYNILQTYNGYFAVADYEGCKRYHNSLVDVTTRAGDKLNLNRRLSENPALIALLIEKRERAERLDVQMEISLKCSLAGLPIDELDVCRVIACLLDNAIEAADSSEQRRLSYTMEQKTDATKLIIITNSTATTPDMQAMFTAGTTSKAGHEGIGLNTVRKVINKYGNCSFQISCYNNEMTAYLELMQVGSGK